MIRNFLAFEVSYSRKPHPHSGMLYARLSLKKKKYNVNEIVCFNADMPKISKIQIVAYLLILLVHVDSGTEQVASHLSPWIG